MSRVLISTERGDMIAELYDNETPITTNNFKELIAKKFYDGLTFHRVIPNFVIQGGCPNGLGNGGPGYRIPCEVNADKQYHDRGVLSMAHAGRITGVVKFSGVFYFVFWFWVEREIPRIPDPKIVCRVR